MLLHTLSIAVNNAQFTLVYIWLARIHSIRANITFTYILSLDALDFLDNVLDVLVWDTLILKYSSIVTY